MTPSYCLSSPRNTTTQHFLTRLSRKEATSNTNTNTATSFKPHYSLKPFLPVLRLRSSNYFTPTFATISSFAEGDDQQKVEDQDTDKLPGMAQAFHISSGTASAISICIAFAALALPLFMRSLGPSLAVKTKALSYVTLLFGFYMAWNIGANDVANAMGTSVGSGALTLRQAVITAGVLEFSGALLMGTHVTSTMQKGILVANVFQGKDMLLFAGLLSSLAAAGTWLQVYGIRS